MKFNQKKKYFLTTLSVFLFLGPLVQYIGANETIDGNSKHEELILSLVDKDVESGRFILNGYEISLGEQIHTSINTLTRSVVMTGQTTVSRPWLVGNMSATASTTTTANVAWLYASVRINHGSGSEPSSSSGWRENTSLASTTARGNARSGVAHGTHLGYHTQNAPRTTLSTTNRDFQ